MSNKLTKFSTLPASNRLVLDQDKDSTTRRVLESILSQEQEHADELKDWLTE